MENELYHRAMKFLVTWRDVPPLHRAARMVPGNSSSSVETLVLCVKIYTGKDIVNTRVEPTSMMDMGDIHPNLTTLTKLLDKLILKL